VTTPMQVAHNAVVCLLACVGFWRWYSWSQPHSSHTGENRYANAATQCSSQCICSGNWCCICCSTTPYHRHRHLNENH
jgi:hypothetical protein